MSTIVFLHAHPDDEASQTSGTMHLLAQAGHRVVCVYATNGDHGASPDDLGAEETLVQRRRAEAECSAQVVGTHRIAWLGYHDSGMTGWEQNGHEANFHNADTEEAAAKVAAILDEEDADVLVGYDWHGGYGHPDHIKVHRVAHRAVELAARRPRILDSTGNRDLLRRQVTAAREMGIDPGIDADAPMDDGNPFGTPEDELHWAVPTLSVIDIKRKALACHASQTDVAQLLAMPEEVFAAGFGTEHYVEEGRPAGMVEGLFV